MYRQVRSVGRRWREHVDRAERDGGRLLRGDVGRGGDHHTVVDRVREDVTVDLERWRPRQRHPQEAGRAIPTEVVDLGVDRWPGVLDDN